MNASLPILTIHTSLGEPDKLWILGGHGGGTEQQITTEFVFANGTVVDGPDLPEGNRGQCGFILENGDALVVGNNEALISISPMCSTKEVVNKQCRAKYIYCFLKYIFNNSI